VSEKGRCDVVAGAPKFTFTPEIYMSDLFSLLPPWLHGFLLFAVKLAIYFPKAVESPRMKEILGLTFIKAVGYLWV
jgi:hypothetical protein